MAQTTTNVALLGAGYIASWHANALKRTPGTRISAVCDLSQANAQAIADPIGASVYTDLEEMLEKDPCTVVHVLTPPHAHFDPAQAILKSGRHCFVEKPFCLASDEADKLSALARENNVSLGINHNFLMLPGYEKLRRDIENSKIGMLDHVQLNWRLPLAPLRAGPYGLWMLRAPENILFEIGSHLFAFAADLFDDLDDISVNLRHPVTIPGDITHFQGWSIAARSGATQINIDISLIEGHDDRSVSVRGTGASARFSFAEDSYHFERTPMHDIVVGPFVQQMSNAMQATRTGVVNAVRQASSLNSLGPYGLSMTRGVQSFYASLAKGTPIDRRLSPELAKTAIEHMEDVLDKASPAIEAAQNKTNIKENALSENSEAAEPDVLVIGGTGFIGRHTCHALADAGHHVRVFSRGRVTGFEREDGRITGFTGDLKNTEDVMAALNGIDTVYNFARATETSWERYLENDVNVAKHIGQCCLDAGIRRLIYTGTISSYDTSTDDITISEAVPFDEDLEERDLYSRSKAKCEAELMAMHENDGLPLVIVRPGIVIGEGGPLQHWGIAMWRSSTACKMWGNGRNTMPFVLVEDVANGLVAAMNAASIEGEAFNLVGDPLLSTRDYFSAIATGYGVAMRAIPTPTWRYFVVDTVKYYAKRYLKGQRDLTRPTLRDWQCRAQRSPYDNTKPKQVLGWSPEADRAAFIERGITGISLFGVDKTHAEQPAFMKTQ